MAGKSTYLRQAALIVLMAQIGSFVPAAEATVGIVDRIFTRIGAADSIARGRSTFMVEMQETAAILRNATARSFVVLDEVGRGTSTFDGLSIAWAVTEYLHDDASGRPRTLFATHYHELTHLARDLERVVNLNVLVREWNDEVRFLHRIVAGAADRSYGIQVARLAGLPGPVLERAREVLEHLEAGRLDRVEESLHETEPPQLDLFSPPAEEVLEELAELDPERLTPIEALAALDRLRRKYLGRATPARNSKPAR
jgi:DNA mismatch repair protein MutS